MDPRWDRVGDVDVVCFITTWLLQD
jgi:hypothetical protein